MVFKVYVAQSEGVTLIDKGGRDVFVSKMKNFLLGQIFQNVNKIIFNKINSFLTRLKVYETYTRQNISRFEL